jgi:hypothetical protein
MKTPTPLEFIDHSLDSVFGMVEMEEAARVIIEKCAKNDNSWDTSVGLKDFSTGDETIGFLNLLAGGWMEDSEEGGHTRFCVRKEFIRRLRKDV